MSTKFVNIQQTLRWQGELLAKNCVGSRCCGRPRTSGCLQTGRRSELPPRGRLRDAVCRPAGEHRRIQADPDRSQFRQLSIRRRGHRIFSANIKGRISASRCWIFLPWPANPFVIPVPMILATPISPPAFAMPAWCSVGIATFGTHRLPLPSFCTASWADCICWQPNSRRASLHRRLPCRRSIPLNLVCP